MPLKMRSTGLGHGVYKDDRRLRRLLRRVVHRPHLSDAHRPRVAALVLGAARSQQAREHADLQPGGNARSAKAEFEASWKQWKAWAKLEEVA